MPTTDLKTLDQAKRRIERLESHFGELKSAIGLVVSSMSSQGLKFTPKAKKALRFFGLADMSSKSEPPREGSHKPGLPRRGQARPGKNQPRTLVTGTAEKGSKTVAAEPKLEAAGEAARVAWIRSGAVVPAKALADHWGLTPQALTPAAGRGELFAIVVKRQRYYPSEFLALNRDDVATVTKALGPLSSEEKLVFWKRPHGMLGGKSVGAVLAEGKGGPQFVRVVQLAQAWSAQARAQAQLEAQQAKA